MQLAFPRPGLLILILAHLSPALAGESSFPPASCFEAPAETGMTHHSGITAQYVSPPGTSSNTFYFRVPSRLSSQNHVYAGSNWSRGMNRLEAGLQKDADGWHPFLRFPGTGALNGKACLTPSPKSATVCIRLTRSPNGYVPLAGSRIGQAGRDWFQPGFTHDDGDPLSITTGYTSSTGNLRIRYAEESHPRAVLTIELGIGKRLSPQLLFTSQQALNQAMRASPRACQDLKEFFAHVTSSVKVTARRR